MSESFQECMQKAKAAAARRSWPEAEQAFRRAMQLKADSAGATRGLGLALASQQKFGEAEILWRAAVQLEPDSADSHQMLGSVLMAKRDLAGASTHFLRALELNPGLAEPAFNLGRIAYSAQNIPRAADYFLKAVAAHPLHIKALAAAVQALTEVSREPEAIAAAEQGLARLRDRTEIPPASYQAVWGQLAHAYRRTNDTAGAAKCYRAILAVTPDDATAAHLLAAVEGTLTHTFVQDFAKNAFDTLAENFDHHLLDHLKYRAPALMAEVLGALRGDPRAFPAVLDLGCGTGLIGMVLAQTFELEKLVGVDLSENMLREAKKRGLYSELIAGDVAAAMAARADRFDLIVAADVFVYVGDLSEVFTQAARLLNPGGLFTFSVEVSPAADVELVSTGHFRHGKDYITRMAEAQQFHITRLVEAPIRTEINQDVLGYYAYLTKPR
jgi:predicted TPR repeat methyltransferase